MPEIQPADPRVRRRAVTLIVLGALAGSVLIQLSESQRPALEAWVTRDASQFDRRLRLVAIGLGAAFGVPTLLFATYFWQLGARIVRNGRFPPPGMRVIHDTVVLGGPAARRRGRMLQTLAVILLLTVVGFTGILWRLVLLVQSQTTSAAVGGP